MISFTRYLYAMGKMAVATGVAYHHDEVASDVARQWTLRQIEGLPYLYANHIRGLIANRMRYKTLASLPESEFLHGLYMGLCDYFNGGCEIEDMTDEVCELLGLRPTGIPGRSDVMREKRALADARREEERLAAEAARRARWEALNAR